MSLSISLRAFFLVLVLLLSIEAKVGFAQGNDSETNYITWDDFNVDYHHGRLPLGDLVNLMNKVIVVDKYGSGNSFTVQGAVDLVPENNNQRVKIHILPGVYREKVHIPRNKPYISFIGQQNRASETVITWHDKAGDRGPNGGGDLGTQRSASVTVESDFFVASSISFQNTIVARPGLRGAQAVALRIAGEKAVFYRARFLGSQDTLLDEAGSHYFYRCFIQGSTDFVFGNARSLYQECDISVVDGFAVAAHHRNTAAEETGFSFVNCTVRGSGVVYLGRAWGEYSRIVYSNSDLNIRVKPRGWDDWHHSSRRKTVMFGEYNCRGRGANRRRRAHWSKSLSYSEAKPFLDTKFINGDQWLRL